MSALWGTQTPRKPALLISTALVITLMGCEYSGPAEQPAHTSAWAATEPPRSFEENVEKVARLLDLPLADPGMPSEAEPAGELSVVLAPGDYMVKTACAGVYSGTLTILRGEGPPETTGFTCDAMQQRFVRHAGGPIAISAIPAAGRLAAAGVTVQPNSDPRASELEDMREWSSRALKPELPGELAGSASSNTTTSFGMQSAEPGSHELHFICEGPSEAGLSVSTPAGAEVLAPVQVQCGGGVFKAQVQLATKGADFTMDPGSGSEGRFAFRLVPSA